MVAADWSRLARQGHNDRSEVAKAVVYKLSLVGISYQLTNK